MILDLFCLYILFLFGHCGFSINSLMRKRGAGSSLILDLALFTQRLQFRLGGIVLALSMILHCLLNTVPF